MKHVIILFLLSFSVNAQVSWAFDHMKFHPSYLWPERYAMTEGDHILRDDYTKKFAEIKEYLADVPLRDCATNYPCYIGIIKAFIPADENALRLLQNPDGGSNCSQPDIDIRRYPQCFTINPKFWPSIVFSPFIDTNGNLSEKEVTVSMLYTVQNNSPNTMKDLKRQFSNLHEIIGRSYTSPIYRATFLNWINPNNKYKFIESSDALLGAIPASRFVGQIEHGYLSQELIAPLTPRERMEFLLKSKWKSLAAINDQVRTHQWLVNITAMRKYPNADVSDQVFIDSSIALWQMMLPLKDIDTQSFTTVEDKKMAEKIFRYGDSFWMTLVNSLDINTPVDNPLSFGLMPITSEEINIMAIDIMLGAKKTIRTFGNRSKLLLTRLVPLGAGGEYYTGRGFAQHNPSAQLRAKVKEVLIEILKRDPQARNQNRERKHRSQFYDIMYKYMVKGQPSQGTKHEDRVFAREIMKEIGWGYRRGFVPNLKKWQDMALRMIRRIKNYEAGRSDTITEEIYLQNKSLLADIVAIFRTAYQPNGTPREQRISKDIIKLYNKAKKEVDEGWERWRKAGRQGPSEPYRDLIREEYLRLVDFID